MAKRRIAQVAGWSALCLALAGCGAADERVGAAPRPVSQAQADQDVQIFSWWTAKGETNALNALISVFRSRYPNEHIVNEAVAGGGGDNAKAVLASRITAGDPPETFQVHVGQELMVWVKAGKMEPLDALYRELDLYKVLPQVVLDGVTYQGHLYAVPIDVERGNVLWYNPHVLNEYGLKPPQTWDQLLEDCKVLKAHGVIPIAYGDRDQLGSVMLWEDVLLATAGPKTYDGIWNGTVSISSPVIRKACENFLQLLPYTNADHAQLSWDGACGLVASGQAAFDAMGDWAKAYFVASGLKEGRDFGWTPFPGTSGDFEYVIDTFGMPKGSKNPEGALDFLRVVASREAEKRFNLWKGSIPPRTDVPLTGFDAYSLASAAAFRKDALVPSLANGEAANPAFEQAAAQAITMLINTGNVSQFMQLLKQADLANPLP
ncbi:ABC transporter substrate-binding protein [Alicyclobacillus sendaiensis]|uniref:Probable sugar-binding periplasmic protein n=1 Tax=Alicyclobacillus sendaiensis PA2 TaxID=3029425 RepID=A0ABT6Y1B0_ALISE|nr:ABC transporter substrate-binding protein [Alicyclobacillus sendaiensis]MDI9261131.1 ABC transporter substrate-binding protein [Alicyclobacillus sendaiensis PA2]